MFNLNKIANIFIISGIILAVILGGADCNTFDIIWWLHCLWFFVLCGGGFMMKFCALMDRDR